MSNRLKALLYYVLTRLLLAPVMLWTIATLVFLLMRATPGDPVDAILGPRAPTAVKDALREQLGLAGSLWDQYWHYLNNLIHFDLGTSLTTRGQPTWEIIQSFFPATAELAIYSMLVAASIGSGHWHPGGAERKYRLGFVWALVWHYYLFAATVLDWHVVAAFPVGATGLVSDRYTFPATLPPPERNYGFIYDRCTVAWQLVAVYNQLSLFNFACIQSGNCA
jgi:hypothetical protein